MNCWLCGEQDEDSANHTPPPLQNPREIAAGRESTCALDDSSPPSNLKNPRNLKMGSYDACITDDEGIHCWGENKELIPAPLFP